MRGNKFLYFEKCSIGTRLKILLWLFVLTGLFVLFTFYTPIEYLFHYLGFEQTNGCILLTLAGFPCPMCGMGRSFPALLELDFNGMIYYNPSSVVFYAAAILLFVTVFVSSIAGYKVIIRTSLFRLWYLAVITLAAVWILNIIYGHHNL
jgi:hypothetical protein